ncbi:DUF2634 domain-containing protein [Paenibacillus sp. ACRRX]|uniref:DUF2634 domain-containing protein n=1 Tax=Paenibacillus sp. ACRRX TaxID=2918206 RepID=UPI001EF5453E|nr:DUF2634 domain-containing protein [Paenibacillus sp. ACRRX]MCG7410568.1 DUF2634 domain-containing protein [Paenibacillus sp. ACRRX]
MFPVNDYEQEDTAAVAPAMGKVFLFDFKEKRHVVQDGKPVEATYEQAIQQWLTMLLITDLDKYAIYQDTGFGMTFREFIGSRDLPVGVVVSEVKRQLEEQAIRHPEIESLSNFSMTRDNNVAHMSFDVETKRGVFTGFENEVKYSG